MVTPAVKAWHATGEVQPRSRSQMESTNLKPLRPSDDGRDYVKNCLASNKLQRTQALRAINASHINVSLDVLEHS